MVALVPEWTSLALARCAIIDAVAVAKVEAALSAEAPNRHLHEAGEHGRAARVQHACVDGLSRLLDQVGAATWRIAAGAINVLNPVFMKDASTMHPVMNERVDGDHRGSGRDPALASRISAQQNVGEGHRQHLIGDALNPAQRFQQGCSHLLDATESGWVISQLQLLIDPADEIAATDIASKKH